mgnify:CR=1 FL=1
MNEKSNLIRMIRNYKFRSLFIQTLLLVFFVVIVPFAGMGSIAYMKMNQAMRDEIGNANLSTLFRIRDVIDTIFKQMDHISLELILQSDVEHFLNNKDTNNFQSANYRSIFEKIQMYTRTYDYIDSVYVYSDINKYIISNRHSTPLDIFDDSSWHSFVYESIDRNAPYVHLRKRNDIYPYYISFTRPAYFFERKLGAVTSNIDIEELRRFLDKSKLQFDHLYIVDGNGNLMYSHNREEFMMPAAALPYLRHFEPQGQMEATSFVNIQGENFVQTVVRSNYGQWTYVSLLPLKRYESNIQDLNRFLLLLFLIGAVVVFAVSLLISYKTFSPVRQIMALIEQQDKAEPAMEWGERKQLNELKVIANSIFQTMDAKKILQKELQLRQELLNKTQTVALQTQINPHFLYNTLEAIKYLAVDLTKGQNQASRAVNDLSDMLRFSLDTNEPLTDLRSEIAHAQCYVNLMNLRYGGRFHVEWEIDEQLLDCRVVKLSLQPLIENAIKHGFIKKRKEGLLFIRVTGTGDHIEMIVSDNGAGMDEGQLQALNDSLHGTFVLDDKHIGLKNVNQRIKLIYGESYGLEVDSRRDSGTTVRIVIPRRPKLESEPAENRPGA